MADAFTRIDKALATYYANYGRTDYLDENGNGKFLLFVEDNQFEVDDIDDELGDDANADDCSYTEMDDNFPLPNSQKEADTTAIFEIIKYCYTHNKAPNIPNNMIKNNAYDDTSDIIDEGADDMKNNIFTNFNIKVHEKDLYFIEQQLKEQCNDLRPKGSSANSDQDKATYAILQIGKQNRNQPLLTYLVDAFNRYRIQKRKKLIQKLKKTAYDTKTAIIKFDNKFSDPNPAQFITKKCTGIKNWLQDEYTSQQQSNFLEMCVSALSVFPRRLLHKPPMNDIALTAWIDDNIIDISTYILQCYTFIDQFVQQQNAPLPAQIDVVIIPKKYKMIDWDAKDLKNIKGSDVSSVSSEDEKDIFGDEEVKDNEPMYIGDMNKRLSAQKNKIKCRDIEYGTANRTMLQSINEIFDYKRCQRGILIIDRRNNFKKDELYGFQPNVEKNKQKQCHCFEAGDKLLVEALIQNLRICVLPKVDNEMENINVNTHRPFGLTFSFHCFGVNDIRVYVCHNGWGARFFIEDIKYFLPLFFVGNQRAKLEYAFTKAKDRSFADKYGQCKKKLTDAKFEQFYKSLFDDDKHRSH